jgi:hypothetical protein
VKKKIIYSLENIDVHNQAIYDDKKYSKKSLHILEDVASGVQVGGIEQVTVQKFFLNDNIKLMGFYKVPRWYPQVHNEFKEYEEKKNLTSK